MSTKTQRLEKIAEQTQEAIQELIDKYELTPVCFTVKPGGEKGLCIQSTNSNLKFWLRPVLKAGRFIIRRTFGPKWYVFDSDNREEIYFQHVMAEIHFTSSNINSKIYNCVMDYHVVFYKAEKRKLQAV